MKFCVHFLATWWLHSRDKISKKKTKSYSDAIFNYKSDILLVFDYKGVNKKNEFVEYQKKYILSRGDRSAKSVDIAMWLTKS